MPPQMRLQQVMVLGMWRFITTMLLTMNDELNYASLAMTVWSPVVGWFMVTQGLLSSGR